jgi:hypothetical protein
MNERIFSLVCALLTNDYVVRVQRPGPGSYDICDYEDGDEGEVDRCYNRVISVPFSTLWIFRKDEWYMEYDAEAVAMLELDTEADTVLHHREYEVDEFITNRVKESANND